MRARTTCFFFAFGLTIFACSSAQDTTGEPTDSASSDLGAVACGKGACGPEMGAPAIACEDGSIGGNTGRCIRPASSTTAAKCHWEIRECPKPKPTACDCGPKPDLLLACPDGTTHAPICVDDPSATSGGPQAAAGGAPSTTPVKGPACHWQIAPCPPVPSPVPPSACPPGEHVCQMADPAGFCVDKCIPAGAMCVAPSCKPVCDPAGPRPNPACSWDTKACTWNCPVCDPVGGPKPGCTWDSKACVWLCL